jgi:DtxR family Mn-dependent transcriptional regulator
VTYDARKTGSESLFGDRTRMPTATLEEYLETIYKLALEGPVKPTQIAESIGVSGPTVTATLKRLEGHGLVTRHGTQVILTESGTARSLEIIRKHRIAERFLVDVLGLDWEAAHADACLLEHAMSSRVLEALERYLDNPQECPHGHPIPTAAGIAEETPGRSLSDAKAGESFKVLRVAEDESVLGYLGNRGLRPGAALHVVERDSIGGLLTLEIEGEPLVLALDVAKHVIVG